MQLLLVLLIVYLSFMYKINQAIVFKIFAGKQIKLAFVKRNFYLLWFFIVIVLAILTKTINSLLVVPNQILPLTEFLLFILLLIPFMLNSGYTPHRSLAGIISFCIIFPIGEELIFRGMIPIIFSRIMNGKSLEIPFPILKEVSLAVFVSSLLFGFMHLQYFDFRINKNTLVKVLYAFIFGIFIGNLAEVSGSLIYAFIFHIIANCGATYIYFRRN